MRVRTLCVSALTVAVLSQIAPIARAGNDGEWLPTTDIKWWYKYVYPVGDLHPTWMKTVVASQVLVDKAQAIPGSLDTRTPVTFTFKNTSSTAFKGGGSIVVQHAVAMGDGSVRTEIMARALLPALGAGQSFRVSGMATVGGKSQGLKQFIEVEAR